MGRSTSATGIRRAAAESGYIAIKPDDPDIVAASGPTGQRAYNDHMTLYNHRTGQRWIITAWPELYGWGVGAGRLKYRFQWTFPIMFSRHDPECCMFAASICIARPIWAPALR